MMEDPVSSSLNSIFDFIMHRMAAERQFGNLLEAARSEKSWKNVRAYLNIFEEYFTYTNDKQKEQTLGRLRDARANSAGTIAAQIVAAKPA